MSYVDIFGGSTVQPADVSYTALELTEENTDLVWPSQYVDTANIVSRIIDVTPTEENQTLTLPSAKYVSVGQDLLINNPSDIDFELFPNGEVDGFTIEAGNIIYFYLTDNSTDGGEWRVIPFGGGVASVTAIDADVPDATDAANLVITGVPITSAGTISFAFDGDLEALIGFGINTGIAVRTGVETWALRSVTAALNGNLTVTNSNGVAGNITIDTQTTLGIAPQTAITAIRVGNITLSANTINSSNTNGNLTLTADGNGEVRSGSVFALNSGHALKFYNAGNTNSMSLNASALLVDVSLNLPTAVPADGQVLQYQGENQLVWATVPTFPGASTDMAVARYNGTGGGLQNSAVIIDDTNNITTAGNIHTTTGNLIAGTLTIRDNNIIESSANPIAIRPAPGSNTEISSNVIVGSADISKSILFAIGNSFLYLTPPPAPWTGDIILTLPNAMGPANGLMKTDGAGVLSFTDPTTATSAVLADVAAMIAESAGGTPVTPSKVVASPVVIKARAHFVVVGGAAVISDSYGVNSVTRTGAGAYNVETTRNFLNTNYQITLGMTDIGFIRYAITGVATFTINTFAPDGVTGIDPTSVSFMAAATQIFI